MAGMLETGIALTYSTNGFEVLGKLSKMTNDLLVEMNDLSKSIGALKVDTAGLASSLTNLGTTAPLGSLAWARRRVRLARRSKN
jgi:hypothetical protein